MRKLVQTLVLAGLVGAPALAMADNHASAHTVTGNVGFASEYVFRGVSQTPDSIALQGGFDYSHSSGLYLGTWASNVDEDLYDANLELDVYGGYKFSVGEVGLDVGGLYYHYPSSEFTPGVSTDDPDTFEVYAGASWKWFSGKLWYSTTDYFGAVDTEGTTYFDLNFNYTLPMDVGLVAHYGWTEVDGNAALDYEDWKIGVTKSFAGFNFGLFYTDTDLPTTLVNGEDIAEGRAVLTIGKTF